MVLLQYPIHYPGELAGIPYPELNGSLWTIAYEFRCYLLVAIFQIFGFLNRKYFMLSIVVISVVFSLFFSFKIHHHSSASTSIAVWMDNHWLHSFSLIMGTPTNTVRLTPIFFVGMCFYLFREAIFPKLNRFTVGFCATMAAVLMYRNENFAEFGLIAFGSFVVFWAAFKMNISPFNSINDKYDISYGAYLYGWPIATFIRWRDPTMSPWLLTGLTLPIALAAGAASWFLVESRARDWGKALVRGVKSSTPLT